MYEGIPELGRMKIRFSYILIAAALAAGCARENRNVTAAETSREVPPLVSLCHGIDYSDTVRLHSEPYMKKTVGRIVKLMSVTDSTTTDHALSFFFSQIKRDDEALNLATRLATIYLNSPASPARDETLFIRMLRTLLSTDSLAEAVRIRGEEHLRRALLNRPGSIATDIRYLNREGREGNLHTFEAPQTLLIFYDPECSHCSEILNKIANHQGINEAIENGKLGVLAIYAEGKRDVWDKTKADMPRNWTIGYDLTGILDRELYDLPAMPIVYLLDDDHRVLLKDPNVNTLLR